MLAAFSSVVDAVACAAAMQRARRRTTRPRPGPSASRCGSASTSARSSGRGRQLWQGVNMAARLEQLGEPGGVAVSGTARRAAGDAGPAARVHRRAPGQEHQPQGAGLPAAAGRRRAGRDRRGRPPATAGVAPPAHGGAGRPAARGARRRGLVAMAAGPAAAKPSIAVLPFASIGDDAATGRLANGLVEDIVTDLASYQQFSSSRATRPRLTRTSPWTSARSARTWACGMLRQPPGDRRSRSHQGAAC